MPRILSVLISALTLTAAAGPLGADADPWRLHDALGLPDWVTLTGQQRLRFENLDHQFRAGRGGGDQVLAIRNSLFGELSFAGLRLAAEMLDARAALDDRGTPLSTGDVNPLDLLQARAELELRGYLQAGDRLAFRAGRFTMDTGSRRLVSRNNYRNAINAFTGADLQWTGARGDELRLFYTVPVQRRAGPDLNSAEIEWDRESDRTRFWGAFAAAASLPWPGRGEIYLYGLDEDDSVQLATRNRELYTAGMRLFREAATGRIDFQFESIWQFGNSRATTAAADRSDLDHSAHFQHAQLGYTLDAPWRPRLAALMDYASGDEDPDDGEQNRFDTLFGSRRSEYGPSGIYGPFARANIVSPGLRVAAAPHARLKFTGTVRGWWLASKRDAWPVAGVQDPGGRSGRYVGTQFELQLQWSALPGNLDFEAGVAHLIDGDLMQSPPGNGNGAATLLYLQSLITF